ncbi:hypothetical protein [Allorhodopirellula heiligendammensis]|uniref:Uncharacterized protein n=1 Tax=Allorhodopirellula heiligendammensis TaxID=2714739 RepID=A0A5C6C5R0_9BACT|nr:hypothetical protein [Allorhodopirellula heiligendammensis]TWU19933.1 hypothetical protein Poly21_21120 [Allorhodopirellula heiligendammensis]
MHSTIALAPHLNGPDSRLASDAQTDAMEGNFSVDVIRLALRALVAAHLTALQQLSTILEDERSSLHRLRPRKLETLRAGLPSQGLDFRDPANEN